MQVFNAKNVRPAYPPNEMVSARPFATVPGIRAVTAASPALSPPIGRQIIIKKLEFLACAIRPFRRALPSQWGAIFFPMRCQSTVASAGELCQTTANQGPNLWPSDGDAKLYDQEFTMGSPMMSRTHCRKLPELSAHRPSNELLDKCGNERQTPWGLAGGIKHRVGQSCGRGDGAGLAGGTPRHIPTRDKPRPHFR
jgi:hypothetical protein